MNAAQRKTTFVVVAVVFLTYLVSTGLAFIITPMANETGMDEGSMQTALALPSITSLLIIFVAGQLGDRFGARESVMWLGGVFALGGLMLAASPNVWLLALGLGLCGAAATCIQVIMLGFLQGSLPDGKVRISGFSTFGMIFPLALLFLPLLTARCIDVWGWRVVMLIWVFAGMVMVLLTVVLIKPTQPHKKAKSTGWLQPILVGLVFAGVTRFVIELGTSTANSWRAIFGVVIAALAGIVLVGVRRRRTEKAKFSFKMLTNNRVRVLLIGVGLVAMVGTMTYVTIALKNIYGLDELGAAVAVIPAQLGGILGAKVIASWLMHKVGLSRASEILIFCLAVSFVPLMFMQSNFPMWYLIGCAVLFNTFALATITVLDAEVMSYAPTNAAGKTSAFHSAASSLGKAMAVVVLGTVVLSAINIGAPSGGLSADQLDEMTRGLRLDAVFATLATIIGWVLLTLVSKRLAKDAKSASSVDATGGTR